VGLLFGEDHRPLVISKDEKTPRESQGSGGQSTARRETPTTDWIAAFIKDTQFWLTMMDATWQGSVGSAFVVLRVLGKQKDVPGDPDPESGEPTSRREPDGPGKYFFELWPAEQCTPVFDRQSPDDLISVNREYFISEDSLRAQGYDVDAIVQQWNAKGNRAWKNAARIYAQSQVGMNAKQDWVLRVTLDTKAETWYEPVPRFIYERRDWKQSSWILDTGRTFDHELGEVPGQWVRPFPIDADDLYPDGACIFDAVIDYQFRIDRTVSQTGRALDYAGDPQMARILAAGPEAAAGKFGFGTDVAMGGTASDVLESSAGGDLKFVEITGQGLEVAIDTYVETLRDLAREAGAMSRVTPDSKTGASGPLSAAAMKLLNFAQLVLCGILRQTCGEHAGSRLLRLAMRMADKVDVALPSLQDASSVKPDAEANLEWQWPDYYELHGQEKLFEVQAAAISKDNNFISQETGIANVGAMYDVQNVSDERERIEADQANDVAQEVTRQEALNKVTPPAKEGVPA